MIRGCVDGMSIPKCLFESQGKLEVYMDRSCSFPTTRLNKKQTNSAKVQELVD